MQKRAERSSSASRGEEVAEQFMDRAFVFQALQVTVMARLDSIAQILFSAGLIADVLPRLWERDPQEGRTRQTELTLLTLRALAEVQLLLLELHLPELAEGDQAGALVKKEP